MNAENLDTSRTKDNMASCNKCHWWCFTCSVTGRCKRMPPAAHFDSGHYWPITGRADWCGEFKPRKAYEHIMA